MMSPPSTRSWSGRTTNGIQISTVSNSKPAVSTPATVCGSPFSPTGAPTMSGSDPNRFIQVLWFNNTMRCASSTASASVKSRPRCGAARSNGKNEGDTAAPKRLTGPSGLSRTTGRGE